MTMNNADFLKRVPLFSDLKEEELSLEEGKNDPIRKRN